MTWQTRYESSLMNTFGTPKLLLTRGEGAHVWDADGREYVDLLGGIAVNALGHAHPAIIEAVTTQLQTLGHVSNFFASGPQLALAERLLGLLSGLEEGALRPSSAEVEEGALRPSSAEVEEGALRPSRNLGRVFFSNSGAEANEAALKLTRRTGRTHLVATEGAFHGRTMGALALTAKAAYREPFEPLPGTVTFVPYGDADALAAAVTDETAAVVLEPIQGEAGVRVPPTGYLAAARQICDDNGSLLWLDEVQTGIGRTGAWFAHQLPSGQGVVPDVVTLAKGLGGGLPIGATIGVGKAGALLEPGNHGTTFGGNPVACAAALAVLDTIEKDHLLDHVSALGTTLRDELGKDIRVTETRGEGLMIGLELTVDAPRVVAAAMAEGFILNATGPSTIRLVPPLVLTEADAHGFIDAWPSILDTAEAAPA